MAGDAGEGLVTVILRVVLALAGVTAAGVGVWVSGVVRWAGPEGAGEGAVDEAGAAGGEIGFTGWTVEGAEVTEGSDVDVFMPAGFIAGKVMVDVTTEGPGADESVLTTTAPLDFWGAGKNKLILKN